MTIGEQIGLVATVGVVILTGFLGAWLTKLEGLRTLKRYRQAIAEGRLPHAEVLEGLMILVAGAVLLTPGFLTDAVGYSLLVPPIRSFLVVRLEHYLKKHIRFVGAPRGTVAGSGGPTPDSQRPKNRVIDAEVIDE